MFERFTERARQVVVFAQEQARELGHNQIGTEHILLGLLREDEGLAGRVLEAIGVTLAQAREQVVRAIVFGEATATGQMPFTPRAKKVLELALRESQSLGHNYVGTEHILLGLVRNEGVAARILRIEFDAGQDRIREEVSRMLSATASGRLGARPERSPGPHLPASALLREARVVAGEKQGAIGAQDAQRFALLHEREGRLYALAIEFRELQDRTRAARDEKKQAIERGSSSERPQRAIGSASWSGSATMRTSWRACSRRRAWRTTPRSTPRSPRSRS